ncbi:MAG: RnfABCDGE type electron transport complex subunit G [Clostridia bacterium]|nr:RnfABCDGE type electron transport complex subunit G [Clostridia bacterium]
MKQIVKNTIVLLVITLVAGSLLAATYAITKNPIKQAEEQAEKEAFLAVFPEASEFQDAEGPFHDTDSLTVGSVKRAKGTNGEELGVAVKVTTSAGYGGDIAMVIGIKTDGTVSGLKILSASNESPGLGANCLKPEFQEQYAGKKTGLTYSKTGAEDNEIDAISGATITTRAVTSAVAAVLDMYEGGADQ